MCGRGVYKVVHWNEIDEIVSRGGYLLDVRTPVEYNTGHIDGSVNIEVDELRSRLAEINLPKDAPLLYYLSGGVARVYRCQDIGRERVYQSV